MTVTQQRMFSLALAAALGAAALIHPRVAEAWQRRGPSPAQIKQMKEELAYRQREMDRVQKEVAAKEREFYLSFDENGNGKLEGGEKARFQKELHAIRKGKAPNPLADIVPPGQGPRTPPKK
jgi:hypothetical protein